MLLRVHVATSSNPSVVEITIFESNDVPLIPLMPSWHITEFDSTIASLLLKLVPVIHTRSPLDCLAYPMTVPWVALDSSDPAGLWTKARQPHTLAYDKSGTVPVIMASGGFPSGLSRTGRQASTLLIASASSSQSHLGSCAASRTTRILWNKVWSCRSAGLDWGELAWGTSSLLIPLPIQKSIIL